MSLQSLNRFCAVFLISILCLLDKIRHVNGYKSSMPLPFYRELYVTKPLMYGNDVITAQTLLNRDSHVSPKLSVDGYYGDACTKATEQFQSSNGLKPTGTVDAATAQLLLNQHSEDGYKDTGFTAKSMGYLYKIYIPVHSNRTVETVGTLYDSVNNVLITFPTRTHGYRDDGSSQPWPDFGNGDVGLTQWASNGNTVTGLIEVDLNSPEPDPEVYGPWPVNRFVRGLDGNALTLLPNIRDGILLHTGNWNTASTGPWLPSEDMPNSSGCIHSHPESVQKIYETLIAQGVVVNPNTYSGKNYPYKPQGIAVIEYID